jgi:hypothetical protein
MKKLIHITLVAAALKRPRSREFAYRDIACSHMH